MLCAGSGIRGSVPGARVSFLSWQRRARDAGAEGRRPLSRREYQGKGRLPHRLKWRYAPAGGRWLNGGRRGAAAAEPVTQWVRVPAL